MSSLGLCDKLGYRAVRCCCTQSCALGPQIIIYVYGSSKRVYNVLQSARLGPFASALKACRPPHGRFMPGSSNDEIERI